MKEAIIVCLSSLLISSVIPIALGHSNHTLYFKYVVDGNIKISTIHNVYATCYIVGSSGGKMDMNHETSITESIKDECRGVANGGEMNKRAGIKELKSFTLVPGAKAMVVNGEELNADVVVDCTFCAPRFREEISGTRLRVFGSDVGLLDWSLPGMPPQLTWLLFVEFLYGGRLSRKWKTIIGPPGDLSTAMHYGYWSRKARIGTGVLAARKTSERKYKLPLLAPLPADFHLQFSTPSNLGYQDEHGYHFHPYQSVQFQHHRPSGNVVT